MCYPCTMCGRCGKFDPESPLYTPPPSIPCLVCGGEVDAATGACRQCGAVAFAPVGTGSILGLEDEESAGADRPS
ncbi:hypothetical protein C1878_02670 [Gordonibacter sp. 28C]|uniref:hypothetical protein n=1 Tax=Gordonibacter sp. 28C TaxID=2078569 RepID=UPI000DF7B514|nr:hypothetical protein [Gordonibacter sp. 28C]RDB63719.1 hypothetical protein C1878_02670 [Gordonibacter sp. 28C]